MSNGVGEIDRSVLAGELDRWVLIDTHCHVHVSLENKSAIKTAADAGCCSQPRSTAAAAAAANRNGDAEQTNSSWSVNIHSTDSIINGHNGRAVPPNQENELLMFCQDEEKQCPLAEKITESVLPLSRVVHVTMGIREEDWAGAVRFATDRHNLGLDRASRSSVGLPAGGSPFGPAAVATPEAEEIQQKSSGVTPQKGAGEAGQIAGSPDFYFRFGIGLHPWCV